jgi:leucyl-tRNA synthetase
VGQDIEDFEFNTVVSSLMELFNSMRAAKKEGAVGTAAWDEAKDFYLRIMAPITPHIAEEMWARIGKPYSVHAQSWPEWDKEIAKDDEITLVVQINGKLRDRIKVPIGLKDEDAKELALSSEVIQIALEGKTHKKVIVVKGKLVNIVI